MSPPPVLPATGERVVPDLQADDPVLAEHLARYAFAAPLVRDRAVLDAACGSGYGSRLLVEAGARSVLGLDRDPTTIAYAAARYGHPRLRFVEGEALPLPFPPATFDLVVSFETIEHLADPAAFAREIKRVLRPGGLCLLSSPNRETYTVKNPFHVREFSADELRELLGSTFAVVRLLSQYGLLCSLIGEAEDFRRERQDPVAARLGWLKNIPPARSLYTIALASDLPLPPSAAPTGMVFGADLFVGFPDLQALREERERLRELLRVRENELAARAGELRMLRSSTSWKITAPLRALKRWWRGGG